MSNSVAQCLKSKSIECAKGQASRFDSARYTPSATKTGCKALGTATRHRAREDIRNTRAGRDGEYHGGDEEREERHELDYNHLMRQRAFRLGERTT